MVAKHGLEINSDDIEDTKSEVECAICNKIFRNKKTSTDNNKVLLAQPTMLFKSLDPNEYIMVAVHIVQDDDIVRPHRIAVKHYGSTAGLDIILKFNGL